jgi:hypothetical protein
MTGNGVAYQNLFVFKVGESTTSTGTTRSRR